MIVTFDNSVGFLQNFRFDQWIYCMIRRLCWLKESINLLPAIELNAISGNSPNKMQALIQPEDITL